MYTTEMAYIMPPFKDLQNILDPLRGAYIAGGAFKSILLGQPIKDVDVFFESHEHWLAAVEEYTRAGYPRVYSTKQAHGYELPSGVIVELIGRTELADTPYDYKGVQDMLDSFDFTVSQMALFYSPNMGATVSCTMLSTSSTSLSSSW